MNIEANRLTKDFLWHQIHAGETHNLYKSISGAIQPTTTEYHNITYTITSHLSKTIEKIISKHRSLKYWSQHNRDISNALTDKTVFQNTAKNITKWQRWRLSKWSCGMCGFIKWLERWKYHNNSNLPRCLTDNETVEQVIQCPHQHA